MGKRPMMGWAAGLRSARRIVDAVRPGRDCRGDLSGSAEVTGLFERLPGRTTGNVFIMKASGVKDNQHRLSCRFDGR